jgi:hypothetical protein
MSISRQDVENVIRQLNEAENNRPNLSVDETIAGIDAVMASDVETWMNGEHHPDRETERVMERVLFAKIEDYHRDISHVIIDPPFVAFSWIIKGTINNEYGECQGCSILEVNEEKKMRRGWIYLDHTQKLITLLVS